MNTGRSYAAFTDEDRKHVEGMLHCGEILDPMSGYGGLTRFCSELGVRSYCLEANPPQYLWQLLCHPGNVAATVEAVDLLLWWRDKWPVPEQSAIMSDDWFPPQSLCLLEQLLELIGQAFSSTANPDPNQQALQVALLLPFVGRLSCGVAANMTIHTKRGGICVYSRWQDDFWLYLMAIRQRLTKIGTDAQCLDHTIVLGDARTHRLPQGRFHGMLTSPPYPNRHDFGAMFRPERAFLAWLDNRDQPTPTPELPPVIGSNIVKDRKNASPKGRVAGHFLAAVASLKRGRVAEFQDRRYYIPYYANYFADLEQAYANVSSAASSDFTGYIIVRNNSHRTLTIPVAESIVETWQSLGFASEIVSITESFHVGTMNPRARGAKARQLEYVIRVARS